MPVVLKNTTPIGAAPVTIVCDNVREPGNLGTILRIAASIPVSKVIVAKGNVYTLHHTFHDALFLYF